MLRELRVLDDAGAAAALAAAPITAAIAACGLATAIPLRLCVSLPLALAHHV